MSNSKFNIHTMAAYRKQKYTRGYNPFDYPEEWEFFRHPFELEEEEDVLTDLLFQIRKMTRRLHLFFDNESCDRLETAFYFSLLDSLSEADDYLLGALWYARYCRLEKLFFLGANHDLSIFFEKLDRLYGELVSKIRSFGEHIVDFNNECYEGDIFLHQYCLLTKHGIRNDMLQALLRVPNFPSDPDNHITIDEKTNFFSYFENIRAGFLLTSNERNVEGATDSSGIEKMLEPVDMLLWHIRGTLLWLVINKIKWVCVNTEAYKNRHNQQLETMYRDAYEEVCGVYARSRAYSRRRDVELPQHCAEQMFLNERKPTDAEVYKYFNTQYKFILLQHNKSQELYFQYRNQLNTFYAEFLNLLLNEETQEDAIDFLFIQTYGKELHAKIARSDMKDSSSETKGESNAQKTYDTVVAGKIIAKELIIEGGGHPHFPECLSLEEGTKLYKFLKQESFIDGEKTPLADFNFLMGASTQYTTPDGPKPICWLLNRQMLREMLFLSFAPLLENGTTKTSLAELVPDCFVDKNGKPLELGKNDERAIDYQKKKALEDFFTTILRPMNPS